MEIKWNTENGKVTVEATANTVQAYVGIAEAMLGEARKILDHYRDQKPNNWTDNGFDELDASIQAVEDALSDADDRMGCGDGEDDYYYSVRLPERAATAYNAGSGNKTEPPIPDHGKPVFNGDFMEGLARCCSGLIVPCPLHQEGDANCPTCGFPWKEHVFGQEGSSSCDPKRKSEKVDSHE